MTGIRLAGEFCCVMAVVLSATWLSRASPQESRESAVPADIEVELTPAANEAVLLETDFGSGFDPQHWEFLGGGWQHLPDANPPRLSLAVKASDYSPPHRSPTHLALCNQVIEGSFEMTVTAISTHEDYGHRDVCFFLGWQDAAHYYYVHLARQTDPHANQVFLVDGADRRAISTRTSAGTPWDEHPHTVRIRRDVASGEILVWFDEAPAPVMQASDLTLTGPGRIGVGSFDDTADFLSLKIVPIPTAPDRSPSPQPAASGDRR